MNKAEREKLRELANITMGQTYFTADLKAETLLALLDHIDALERNNIQLRNLITRTVGWVEEVKCISEQAIQEQRSFITELEIAALASAPEVKNANQKY